MPQASDFDAKLYQISENAQQICNNFAPKTSNIRKSKNKKETSVIHYISVILVRFCFFLLDLLSFVFAYIAIDEFQQILSYPEDGVEAMIRSYIQFLPNVYFVFSGSQQHMMQEMFLSANRPFFQSSLVLSLPCIEEPVYREFANRLLSSQHRLINESTFSYIYQQSDCVTWYVQAILHGIYEHGSYGITKSLVDEVIQELIEEQAMAYQNYCAWLTENQQMLLLAIASESLVSSPLSQQFISTHHLPATSSVKTALKALVDKQLVSKTPTGYLVSDRFFAKWLVRGGIIAN